MRSFRAGSRVLRHVTEGPATEHDAGRRVVLAGQHLEQARLAHPVAADEADLVACVDREACIAEYASCRDIDGKSSRLDHGGAKCYVWMPSAFRPTSHSPKEGALNEEGPGRGCIPRSCGRLRRGQPRRPP